MGAGLPPASAPTAGPGPCRAPQDPARSRVVAPQAGPSAPHAPPTGAGETRFLGHRRAPLPCPHGWGGRGALWGLPHKQTEPFPGAATASQGPHRQRPTGTCGVDVRSGQGTRSARSTERRVRVSRGVRHPWAAPGTCRRQGADADAAAAPGAGGRGRESSYDRSAFSQQECIHYSLRTHKISLLQTHFKSAAFELRRVSQLVSRAARGRSIAVPGAAGRPGAAPGPLGPGLGRPGRVGGLPRSPRPPPCAVLPPRGPRSPLPRAEPGGPACRAPWRDAAPPTGCRGCVVRILG